MTDLNQYRIIVEEIKSIILQREELLTTRNRITASLNGMPGGGSDPHKIDTWIHRLIALDDQLDAEMDKLMEGNEQVRGLINRLPRSRGKNALLFHYINGQTWEQVAKEMHYSPQHIYRLRAEAIKKLIELESVCD
jgi:DNA-directed RNA polymerase specialized sigma subunit